LFIYQSVGIVDSHCLLFRKHHSEITSAFITNVIITVPLLFTYPDMNWFTWQTAKKLFILSWARAWHWNSLTSLYPASILLLLSCQQFSSLNIFSATTV
jgi:hypothetical protein